MTTDVPNTADRGAPKDAAVTDGGGRALYGNFQVTIVPMNGDTPGHTTVVGRVQDGPSLEQVLWTRAAMNGDCQLLTPRIPFCSPTCASGSACTADGVCTRFPTAQSVGTVRVSGVRTAAGQSTFEMLSVTNTYQVPGSVMLPNPAFTEGDTVRVEASGAGAIPAFAVESRGITALALGSTAITVAENMPIPLTWNAPRQMGQRIRVRLDISHHGGTRGMVTCDTADDGELTIAADLVTRLIRLGVAGFPTIVVGRSFTGSSMVQGGVVELQVASDLETPVTIPGLRSCTSDADCDGGTCQPDLRCQ
jgi:hypothetical protein